MTPGSLEVAEQQGVAAGPTRRHRRPHPSPRRRRCACGRLSKRWREDLPLVLDELDLTLAPGTITWVGGRNGVGKTTMLRVAAGLIEPDSGRAEVWGVSPRREPRALPATRVVPARRRPRPLRAADGPAPARVLGADRDGPAAIASASRSSARSTTFELARARRASRRPDVDGPAPAPAYRDDVPPEPEVVLLDEPLTSLDAEGAVLIARRCRGARSATARVLWCSPSGEHLDLQLRRALDARARKARGSMSDLTVPARVRRGDAPRSARLPVLSHAPGQPAADRAVQPHALLLRLAARARQRLPLARRLLRLRRRRHLADQRALLVLLDPRTRCARS